MHGASVFSTPIGRNTNRSPCMQCMIVLDHRFCIRDMHQPGHTFTNTQPLHPIETKSNHSTQRKCLYHRCFGQDRDEHAEVIFSTPDQRLGSVRVPSSLRPVRETERAERGSFQLHPPTHLLHTTPPLAHRRAEPRRCRSARDVCWSATCTTREHEWPRT